LNASNLTITDYVPTGLMVNDADWSPSNAAAGTTATYLYTGILTPGAT